MQKNIWTSILSVLTLCLVICAVSIFFVYSSGMVGYVLIALAGLCLLFLIPFGIEIRSLLPDIVFGLIDNGILAIMAVTGGELAGVAGAIIGGVVGNAVTDGIAGIFEGGFAEKLRAKNVDVKRTVMGSAIGKMAGCLLGAGIVMVFASIIY